MRILFIIFLSGVLLTACNNKKKDKKEDIPVTDSTGIKHDSITVDNTARDSALTQLTKITLTAFKNKDYAALAALVHPDLGVRFSPYSYVDSTTDKIITAAMIADPQFRKKKTLWGANDASMEPIRLSFDDFIRIWIYSHDYLQPENFKIDSIIGRGNTVNNVREMYPGADFTESHFSGFDKSNDGMDWQSLRLVFQKKDGKYYLVGVIHDEWTT